ncbi:uncharacterized protein CLAFUR5_06530 [Fulvia fulva]|uniref:Uncharacterized protein n=1 Tax=Passalora fulva TaxID=5499 RepID=A0A9Q8P8V2_PASFU|nr:uncharacterized protein CLAFUR5_06530 [Fulvia fulva]KAK4624883.1 hypothetical protein CLAFUR0_06390 [Fulvia fulva]UJO17594.1 hypothetical protein CLAFUR5_06530 [Fulvia fulva]WPV30428.1 hypothetical protein CLAFUW7_06384 [Fulvia fulva]
MDTGSLNISAELTLRKSNPWNAPFTNDRTCNYELCPAPEIMTKAVQCQIYRLDDYCSQKCLGKARANHSNHCVQYQAQPLATPTHPIVETHVTADRPTYTFQHNFFDPLKREHEYRIKHYGTARIAKTVVMFADDEDNLAFYQNLKNDGTLRECSVPLTNGPVVGLDMDPIHARQQRKLNRSWSKPITDMNAWIGKSTSQHYCPRRNARRMDST